MGSKSTLGQKLLITVMVVGLIGLIVAASLSSAQKKSLDTRIAAAKMVGFPFEGKDLVPKFDYPESENAAPYYEKAISAYRSLSSRQAAEGVFSDVYEPLDPQARLDLDAFIDDMEPSLTFMWQGSQANYCYFPKDWDKGAAVQFPEYASLKQIAKALAVRAYFAAMNGDVQGAKENYATLRTLARHLSEQPTLIAMLVSIAVDAIRARSIEALFPLALKSESHSKWLRSCADAMPEKWDITRVLRYEAFFGWWMADHLREIGTFLGHDGASGWRLALMTKSQYVARATKSAMLDLYTPAIRDYKAGMDEREILDSLDRRTAMVVANDRIAGVFVGLAAPIFSNFATSLDRVRFRRRSLLAALDVMDHRRKSGQWTNALPTGHLDPFDGQPLRYKLDGEGFRIWSVGIDKSDDDGKTLREAKGGTSDEVFTYPRSRP